jgi:hypothetical protein
VPGFLFLVLVIVTVGAPLGLVLQALAGDVKKAQGCLLEAGSVVAQFQWPLMLFALAAAYVLGVIFFRRDPKKPDSYSACYIWDHGGGREEGEMAVVPLSEKEREEQRQARAITGWGRLLSVLGWMGQRLLFLPTRAEDLDVQFPYRDLKGYLLKRRLNHLANLVPWTKDNPSGRSKMFINALKVRLSLAVPERFAAIVANEAQVRLTTSVWYASLWLGLASFVGLVLWLLGLAVALTHCLGLHEGEAYSSDFVFQCWCTFPAVFSWILAVYAGGIIVRREIIKFLHYQRVREVVWLLEMASCVENGRGVAQVEGITKVLADSSSGPAAVARGQ